METTAQGKIVGFKWWVSADKKLDVGSVFIENNLKNSKKGEGYGGENGEGFSKGYAAQEFKCSSSEIVRRLKHLEPPFAAQLIMDSETDGKGMVTQVVMDVRPIPAEKPEGAHKKAA